jgi:general stress protein CsbA
LLTLIDQAINALYQVFPLFLFILFFNFTLYRLICNAIQMMLVNSGMNWEKLWAELMMLLLAKKVRNS